jgi:hypothetical protein
MNHSTDMTGKKNMGDVEIDDNEWQATREINNNLLNS